MSKNLYFYSIAKADGNGGTYDYYFTNTKYYTPREFEALVTNIYRANSDTLWIVVERLRDEYKFTPLQTLDIYFNDDDEVEVTGDAALTISAIG